MKRLLLLALLAISILPVYSQTSIGVITGNNLAWRYPKNEQIAGTQEYTLKPTWRAGFVTDHHLWKKLYLQPQLLLNNKGVHEKNAGYGTPGSFDFANKRDLRVLYLELQANLLLKESLGKGKLFLGAGPYIARGISGKSKAKGYAVTPDGTKVFDLEAPIKFSNKQVYNTTDVYERKYDAGLNFLAGYELKNGMFFNAVYSLGLAKLNFDDVQKPKNSYVGLSVGYFIKRFK